MSTEVEKLQIAIELSYERKLESMNKQIQLLSEQVRLLQSAAQVDEKIVSYQNDLIEEYKQRLMRNKGE